MLGPVVVLAAQAANVEGAGGSSQAVTLNQWEWREADVRYRDSQPLPSVSIERNPPPVGRDHVTAQVVLTCRAAAAGRVESCAAMPPAAGGTDFASMSLALAPMLRVRPSKVGSSAKPGESITFKLTFRGISAAVASPHVLVPPDWDSLPSAESRISPPEAEGRSGRVVLSCSAAASGLLENCSVVQETPAGLGFGAAALENAKQFRLWPMLLDGQPTGGPTIQIPMTFKPHR